MKNQKKNINTIFNMYRCRNACFGWGTECSFWSRVFTRKIANVSYSNNKASCSKFIEDKL
jgi:hypothetical protein